jgi:pilus assembly protein CpaC
MSMTTVFRVALVGCALHWVLLRRPRTAQGLRVVEGQTSADLRVPMNRAVVVESDMLFAELSVANPAIADIATLSERSIYVLGRAPGRTTMTLLGADGSLIANVEVQVVPDVAELRERLREILPGEPVEVRTANDGIVLSGTVSSGRRRPRHGTGRTLHAGWRVEPDDGRRHAAGDAAGALCRDAAHRAAGLSASLGISGNADGRFGSNARHRPTQRVHEFGNRRSPTGSTGATGAWHQLHLGQLCNWAPAGGAGNQRHGAHAGRAQPDRAVGPDRDLPRRRRIPDPGAGRGRRIGVEFKPFGVNMTFTPTSWTATSSTSADRRGLSIGEINPAREIPVAQHPAARTTVEMRDGESFAIAGLLQDDFRDSSARCRGWAICRSWARCSARPTIQREQSELVIIITAASRNPDAGRGAGPAHRPRHDPHRTRPVPARPHHRRRPGRTGTAGGRGRAAGLQRAPTAT